MPSIRHKNCSHTCAFTYNTRLATLLALKQILTNCNIRNSGRAVMRILGHFQVALNLIMKARLSAKFLL